MVLSHTNHLQVLSLPNLQQACAVDDRHRIMNHLVVDLHTAVADKARACAGDVAHRFLKSKSGREIGADILSSGIQSKKYVPPGSKSTPSD